MNTPEREYDTFLIRVWRASGDASGAVLARVDVVQIEWIARGEKRYYASPAEALAYMLKHWLGDAGIALDCLRDAP